MSRRIAHVEKAAIYVIVSAPAPVLAEEPKQQAAFTQTASIQHCAYQANQKYLGKLFVN